MSNFEIILVFIVWPFTTLADGQADLLCQESGLYAHPTDCGLFVYCQEEENGVFTQSILPCPEGQGFDEYEQQCLEKKSVRRCEDYTDMDDDKVESSFEEYRISDDERACTKPGVMCGTNCSSVVLCVQIGNEFSPIVLEDCTGGLLCNESSHTCTGSTCPVSSCTFDCAAEGVYPDLYDCSAFHFCDINNHDTSSTCPPGQVYDPTSAICKTGSTCELLEPCNNEGEMGVHPASNNIFFFCAADATTKAICPKLFHCPEGQIFDPDTFSCKEP